LVETRLDPSATVSKKKKRKGMKGLQKV